MCNISNLKKLAYASICEANHGGSPMAGRKLVWALASASLILSIGAGAALAADAGPDFQQVLAAPDDLQQNLAYAKAQAQQGHLLAAAAALERILLADPNAHGVRLFYVAVLYRLDDLQGAQQQLEKIDPASLTPLQRREADDYQEKIAHGRSDWHVSGNIALGADYDSDIYGALHDHLDYYYYDRNAKKSGASFIASGNLNIAKDLDANGDRFWFLNTSLYSRTSFKGPNSDFVDFNVSTGLEGSALHSRWMVGGVYREYELFADPYLEEYGGHAEFSWRPNTSLTWMATAEVVGQNFHEPILAHSFIDGSHDGWRLNVSAGPSYRISASDTITAFLGYEYKDAKYAPFEYDAPYLNADYHSLLGDGAYFDASGEVRYVDYRYRDFYFLDGTKRHDWRTTARAALGAPLSYFTAEGATGDYRENLILEAAASYTSRSSEYPISDFDGWGVEGRLIWKFGDTNR